MKEETIEYLSTIRKMDQHSHRMCITKLANLKKVDNWLKS